MAYAKISLAKVRAARPGLCVGDLVEAAIEDHRRANGCEFEENAAARAVERVGLHPNAASADLSDDQMVALGDALEALEISCPHKTALQPDPSQHEHDNQKAPAEQV